MDTRIAGLEEKFRVLNNDELADALHDRIVELSPRPERWIPEALSLLLQLSDQPIQYSRIEDLALLRPEPLLPAPLTWADILAEDPLDNLDGLWDDVDFAATDSEEETEVLDHPDPTVGTPDIIDEIEDSDFDASRYELSIVKDLINEPYWGNTKILEDNSEKSIASTKGVKSIKLTEAQLKREAIFMLLGLPTPIYRPKSEGSLNFEFLEIETGHMSLDALGHLLVEFARLSDSLAKIRAWVRRVETVALLQAFQAGLGSRMNIIERALSDIQSRTLNSSCIYTTSLLDLFNEVSLITRFMQQVAAILVHIQSVPQEYVPFQLLDRLYDKTCLNHSIGDTEGYIDMAQMFFDCFHVYLKPVRAWMKFGELGIHEKTFFIRENIHDVTPEKLWQEQFQLIETEAGILQAPKFFYVAAKKIFTTGKSVNFLKRLGRFNPDQTSALCDQNLNYETVCQENKDFLAPFSALLDSSLERWIADRHQSSSHDLRDVLETECGLTSSLDALEIVYFNRDGAISDDISRVIFGRVDSGIEVWNDGFLLTELFQGVLSTHPSIEPGRLAVRSVGDSCQDMQNTRRSVKILEGFKVWYDLPWPVANIIKPESMNIYQRIFVILSQTQRAKNIIQRQYLMRRVLSKSDGEDGEKNLVYFLRQRLLWFANTLLTYFTNSVLLVATQELRVAMTKAEDVDEMITVHDKFISRLENQFLISKNLSPIHEAVISILDLAILFSDAFVSYRGQLISSHSMTTTTGVGRVPKNARRRTEDATSDSSYDSDQDSSRADISYISFGETPFAERLKDMQASFTNLVAFVIAGLYGVHRAGGEPCWEMLANSLATGLGEEQNYLR